MNYFIPKGWRRLRHGERITYPYKIWRINSFDSSINRNKKMDGFWDDGYSDSHSIGKRINLLWSVVIVPKLKS